MEIRVRGRLGSDPELKSVGTEKLLLVSFSLAFTPRSKKNGQWIDGETNWYRVVKFGVSAEAIAQSLRKGDEVIVIGQLRMNSYTDKNGVQESQMEINASEVGIIPRITNYKTQTTTGGSDPW